MSKVVTSCLAAVSLLAIFRDAAAQNLTTYSGYLVDFYCYGLVSAGGRALDGSNPIVDPAQHTIHCLRDPLQCVRDGYYLAINRGTAGAADYQPKFRLDKVGNDNAQALMHATTRDDRAPGRYTVTVTGVHNGDGVLKDATLTECEPAGAAACDGVCEGNCEVTGGSLVPPPLMPSALLYGHVTCMVLSWGCLLPLGVFWAHNLRANSFRLCDTPVWFQGHRIFQSVGWLLQLIGFACVVLHKQNGGGALARHFTTPHEIVGLTVVILGSLQPLNAQLRHLPFVGHPPMEGEKKTVGRLAWEIMHKGAGYTAVALGALNVMLGIFYARSFGFGGGLVPAAVIVACLSLGPLLVLTIIAEVARLVFDRELLGHDDDDDDDDDKEEGL